MTNQESPRNGLVILAFHSETVPTAAAMPLQEPETGSLTALEQHCRACLERIVERDEAALGELYDATLSKLHGLALRIVRQREAAEEVVEDTFWQVWNSAQRFDPARGNAVTWMLTICRSRALDFLRRREAAESHPDPESLRGSELADHDDPYRLLEAFERQSAVREAVAELSAVQRQMVALAFFRGLTHQEIADASRMPLGTVKTHLHKACKKLMQRLTPDLLDHRT